MIKFGPAMRLTLLRIFNIWERKHTRYSFWEI